MNKFSLLALSIAAISCSRPSEYVNPFVGNADFGHCHPCATVPFGNIQAGPESGNGSWDYTAGYQYRDTVLFGFSQTRLNGTGCPDLGDILVFPFCNELTSVADDVHGCYASRYEKRSQKAVPGYYSVTLEDAGVDAEMTASEHVAYHRYRFDNPSEARVMIDLQSAMVSHDDHFYSHVLESEFRTESPTCVSGHTRTRVWVDRDCYFDIEFSKPVTGAAELEHRHSEEKASRYVLSFDLGGDDVLEMKVAISAESAGGAAKNMAAEIPGWDFDAVRKDALDAWDRELSRIRIHGSRTRKNVFYTSMYHVFLHPNNIADAGENPLFSTLSLWDTYRAEHPLLTIIAPEYVNPLINSMLDINDRQGFLPIWSLWGLETFCMIGNHAVPVIADAFLKGFDGFDAERAYQAVKRTLTEAVLPKTDWQVYDRYGFFPCDIVPEESVSRTLECCYDDWCAAQMARELGHMDDYDFFMKRAGYYRNVYDSASGLVRGRLSDGSWRTPFDRFHLSHEGDAGGDYTEGNAWQYNWHVQHDVDGMIAMNGGAESFVAKLDSLFNMAPVDNKTETSVDVTGLIGQYAHGNEPSHHVAYLYRLAGRPDRTEELVREICDSQYSDAVDGLCGNDDCGQMSAWYIFSTLGIYPVNPCSGEFVFGAPQTRKAVIRLPGGRKFTVIAKGLSPERRHVSRICLNGKVFEGNTISYNDIMAGGELVFTMAI